MRVYQRVYVCVVFVFMCNYAIINLSVKTLSYAKCCKNSYLTVDISLNERTTEETLYVTNVHACNHNDIL